MDTTPAPYSGEIPASEVIAKLNARVAELERDSIMNGGALADKIEKITAFETQLDTLSVDLRTAIHNHEKGLVREERLKTKIEAMTEAGMHLYCCASRKNKARWDAAVSGANTAQDTARLDDLLHTINMRGTLAISERYEFGINLPLDRSAIDAARKASA